MVSGLGFLHAGVIVRERDRIAGLTTAAKIWAVASVGLAIASRMFLLAIITAILLFILLETHQRRGWAFSAGENPRQNEDAEGSRQSPLRHGGGVNPPECD